MNQEESQAEDREETLDSQGSVLCSCSNIHAIRPNFYFWVLFDKETFKLYQVLTIEKLLTELAIRKVPTSTQTPS